MATIYTHLVSIQVVLQNLICNALKHHDHSEGRIIVSVRQSMAWRNFTLPMTDPGSNLDPGTNIRDFSDLGKS